MLLWALLLGEIPLSSEQNDNDPFYGPHKLRENLSSFIRGARNNSRVEMLHQLTYIASRIDSLVRSVRDLETDEDCVCHVAISSDNSNDNLRRRSRWRRLEIHQRRHDVVAGFGFDLQSGGQLAGDGLNQSEHFVRRNRRRIFQ